MREFNVGDVVCLVNPKDYAAYGAGPWMHCNARGTVVNKVVAREIVHEEAHGPLPPGVVYLYKVNYIGGRDGSTRLWTLDVELSPAGPGYMEVA
jgi:hypothetical protein